MIVILACKVARNIKYPVNNANISYLVLVANSLKTLYRLKKKLFENKEQEQEALITYIQKEWQNMWKHNVSGSDGRRMLVRWISTLYVIPIFENLSILLLLILILTSYDIHPIGCLFHIGVVYDDVENTVSLLSSEGVYRYQKVAVVLAVVICIFWLCLKFIQRQLLPDVHVKADSTLHHELGQNFEEQPQNGVLVIDDVEFEESQT